MFYTLRKMVILGMLGILVGFLVYLYERRVVFAPAWDFAEAVHLWTGSTRSDYGVVTGEVLEVTSGDSFQLKDPTGQVFSLKLAGVEAPVAVRFASEDVARQAKTSKSNLVELVGAREVEIELTSLGSQRNGLGVVHVGATNVNVSMAARGMVVVRKNHLKGLRLMDQYELIRAGREASESGVGLWKASGNAAPLVGGRESGIMGHP